MRIKKVPDRRKRGSVPGEDVCDHPVRDAWTHLLGQSDVAFELLDGQSLLRVLLVLLLQLQQERELSF